MCFECAAKLWSADCDDSGVGKRVLCLHGFQDNCGSFDRLIPLLDRRRHEYLCFDWPNHGRSSGTPPGVRWTIEHYVLTVKRVVAARWPGSVRPFTCIGHSMGGQVAVLLAAVYPAEVERLVLLDSAGPVDMYPEDVVPAMRSAIDNLIRLENGVRRTTFLGPVAAFERIKQRSYGPLVDETLTDEAAQTLMVRYYRPRPTGSKYVVANDARLRVTYSDLFSAAQYRNVVERVTCPTLWIRATVSDVYHEDLYGLFIELYGRNPNFRTVKVPGNHDVHINHPGLVAPLVNRFLGAGGGFGKL